MNESSTTRVPINTNRSSTTILPINTNRSSTTILPINTNRSSTVILPTASSPKPTSDLEELFMSKTFLISTGTGGSLFLLSVIFCICSFIRYRKQNTLHRNETHSTTAGSLRQSFKQIAIRGLFSFKQEKLRKEKMNNTSKIDGDQSQDDISQVNVGYNTCDGAIGQSTNHNNKAKCQVYANLTGESLVGKGIYENSTTISENLYCPLTEDGYQYYQQDDGRQRYEVVHLKTSAIDINVQTNMLYQD